VGEQKQKRDKIAKEGKERTNINIMMLQIPSKTATATFETMIAGEGIDEVKLAKSALHKHYQGLCSLPVV
jgi:hypothetical protein